MIFLAAVFKHTHLITNYKNIFWFYHFYSVLMYLSLEFQLRSTVINTSTELYKKVAGSKGK